MQPAAPNPNGSWASASRTVATVPRSTSVEYEKETQSTSNRRFPAPPNRLAPPSRSNGASRNPLSKQKSLHHVPDSEAEEEPVNKNERGKSPLEHVVDMTRRALAPATFYLRQRSQEPSAEAPTNGHNSSYDYSAEEREYQAQKPSSRITHHKKGRMSIDNKAYRPSASDLDEDSEGDDDDRKVRRRKSKKKEPHGGPLTTLPVANYEKKRRRKSKGSKGNSLDMEDEDSTGLSDEQQSEQVSLCQSNNTTVLTHSPSAIDHPSTHLSAQFTSITNPRLGAIPRRFWASRQLHRCRTRIRLYSRN